MIQLQKFYLKKEFLGVRQKVLYKAIKRQKLKLAFLYAERLVWRTVENVDF